MQRPAIRKDSAITLQLLRGPGTTTARGWVQDADDDRIWIRGVDVPVTEGEIAVVDYVVANDARYSARVAIEEPMPESLAVRLRGDWARDQKRADFRISTHGIMLSASHLSQMGERPSARRRKRGERSKMGQTGEMLDISAGGLSFATRAELEAGDLITCHFELPDAGSFSTPARVVRVAASADPTSKRVSVAVMFTEVDEATRSSIRGWVFREQGRRRRAPRDR